MNQNLTSACPKLGQPATIGSRDRFTWVRRIHQGTRPVWSGGEWWAPSLNTDLCSVPRLQLLSAHSASWDQWSFKDSASSFHHFHTCCWAIPTLDKLMWDFGSLKASLSMYKRLFRCWFCFQRLIFTLLKSLLFNNLILPQVLNSVYKSCYSSCA